MEEFRSADRWYAGTGPYAVCSTSHGPLRCGMGRDSLESVDGTVSRASLESLCVPLSGRDGTLASVGGCSVLAVPWDAGKRYPQRYVGTAGNRYPLTIAERNGIAWKRGQPGSGIGAAMSLVYDAEVVLHRH